ncbi:GntR family transcriptional regulator [Gordonia sp. LSe1-13]|uniref:GntR family transcriptional regulator n=1 Tax=Gordonia sesuvii TaxID=3116777 RepID=A0ABU7MEK5_9ACTN|nr:GntR family transcriptional regulator [Gordonia sp. LSe1-13]
MSWATGESAAERVYREVKGQILTNEIPGGELISEGDIATKCDVSRTPVREAFLRLETEGWMRLYPKRGALVVPVSDREARDVVDARTLLEVHAVRVVVDDADSRGDLVARLERNLAAHRATDPADVAEFSRIDAEFHQLIVAAGDNPLLADFFVSLGERHRRMTTTSVRRDDAVPSRILDDHRELLDALARGDADAFADGLAAHLSAVHDLRRTPSS